MAKIAETQTIDTQYSVLSADAFLSDIYGDFHACSEFEFREHTSGDVSLLFTLRDGTPVLYSYSEATGYCYKDGIQQFRATRFNVSGGGNQIIVGVKLVGERLLEISASR